MHTSKTITTILLALFLLLAACTAVSRGADSVPVAVTEAPAGAQPTAGLTEKVVTLIPQATAAALVTPSLPADTPTPQPPPVREVANLQMIDEQTGWAVDDGDRVLRTTGSMAGWKETTLPVRVSSAFFLDASTAFITQKAENQTAQETELVTWRTADGGATWTPARTPLAFPAGEGVPIQLDFTDAQHGWLLFQIWPGMHHCETVIFATQDGAQTWTQVETSLENGQSTAGAAPLRGAYSLPYGPYVLSFLNGTLGFAGNGALNASFDGGHDWRAQTLPRAKDFPALKQAYEYISPPWFSSAKDGVLLDRVYEFSEIYLPPGDIFDVAPRAAYLYYTHDGGATWSPQPAPARTGTVFFRDAAHGWFLGADDLDPQSRPTLFRTTDGGQTWVAAAKDSPLPLGARLQFVSDTLGYASSFYHMARTQQKQQPVELAPFLYQTSDGGATWVPVEVKVGQ